MLKSQTALVIAKAVAYDARLAKADDTAREAMVEAWHEALSDLAYRDCLAAVAAYYRGNDGWLMPLNIRQHVEALRRRRLAATPLPELPAEIAARPRVYAAAIAAAAAAIADGEDQAGALAAAAAAAAAIAAERDAPVRELAP